MSGCFIWFWFTCICMCISSCSNYLFGFVFSRKCFAVHVSTQQTRLVSMMKFICYLSILWKSVIIYFSEPDLFSMCFPFFGVLFVFLFFRCVAGLSTIQVSYDNVFSAFICCVYTVIMRWRDLLWVLTVPVVFILCWIEAFVWVGIVLVCRVWSVCLFDNRLFLFQIWASGWCCCSVAVRYFQRMFHTIIWCSSISLKMLRSIHIWFLLLFLHLLLSKLFWISALYFRLVGKYVLSWSGSPMLVSPLIVRYEFCIDYQSHPQISCVYLYFLSKLYCIFS